MTRPIILDNKKLCIDTADIIAVWYPYFNNENGKNAYELMIWIVRNNTKGECICLYNTLEEAVADYEQLIKALTL